MFKNNCLSALLAALAMSAAGAALAADAVAVLDSKTPCNKPEYPRASLVNEETGVVTLALSIGTDGSVAESRIEKSSGFKNLDKAARAALAKCKFKPALKDGKPEQAWMKIDYAWKLD